MKVYHSKRIDMSRYALLASALVYLFCSSAFAQKIESARYADPGDIRTYSLWSSAQGGTVRYQDVWHTYDENEIVGTATLGDKEYKMIWAKDLALLKRYFCMSNGQICTFEPGVKLLDFPLEKGRKWTTSFTVEGETFVAQVEQERKVAKIEKVRVPAGEFEAFKIVATGLIKGKEKETGNSYAGKEESTDWVAQIDGKLVWVKMTYSNSFKEKFARELVSISSK